jgi:ABC-type bacteriocin/lantibiotic exporter with double-glycine peptidase domain
MAGRIVFVGSVAWVALAASEVGAQTQRVSGGPERSASDLVCGPRCVQFVLKWYGIEAGLIDLVRETQWPGLESGADLASLARAFRNRGITACAVQAGDRRLSDWPYPALVHLSGASSLGHFVVWVPADGPERPPCYWMGLDGYQRDVDETYYRRSGVVLLTSPIVIAETDSAFRTPVMGNWWLLSSSTVLLVALILTANAVRRRKLRRDVGLQLVKEGS